MPVRSHGIDTFSCLHPRPQRSTILVALLHLSLMSLRLRRLRSSPLSTPLLSPPRPYWGRKLLFSVIMCNKRRSVTVAAATAASFPLCCYSCIGRKENVVVNVAVAIVVMLANPVLAATWHFLPECPRAASACLWCVKCSSRRGNYSGRKPQKPNKRKWRRLQLSWQWMEEQGGGGSAACG